MYTNRFICLLVAISLLVVSIGACQPLPTSPTATTIPASSTPTPTPKPVATQTVPPSPTTDPFPPEIVATTPGDVAGVWRLRFKGAGEAFRANLVLREDSTFSFDNVEMRGTVFDGNWRFADGKVTLESEHCPGPFAVGGPCQMTFRVYASMQDGKPLRLRFESLDHPEWIFTQNFNQQYLLPAP